MSAQIIEFPVERIVRLPQLISVEQAERTKLVHMAQAHHQRAEELLAEAADLEFAGR